MCNYIFIKYFYLFRKSKMVEMKSYWPYPIGTPGVAWSPEEK